VQTLSAWHPYVRDAVTSTQSAVLSGKDQTPPVLVGLQLPGLEALGIAALLTLLILVALRLRRRRRVKAQGVPVPADVPELVASPNGAEKETISVG